MFVIKFLIKLKAHCLISVDMTFGSSVSGLSLASGFLGRFLGGWLLGWSLWGSWGWSLGWGSCGSNWGGLLGDSLGSLGGLLGDFLWTYSLLGLGFLCDSLNAGCFCSCYKKGLESKLMEKENKQHPSLLITSTNNSQCYINKNKFLINTALSTIEQHVEWKSIQCFNQEENTYPLWLVRYWWFILLFLTWPLNNLIQFCSAI